ncbi:hypothetical protein Vretifemale_18834 [Volvox reticuliferus]|uniref:alcohol dehydrogenase (NADP(+)) n=1 Tax=Volvox reticuliferus TaxID=1737510 RepID=A0A8J4FVX0_9CHLO|nr:hypothetical protein Vretifemale_18834 [Volvox reticuliferus]
MGPFYTLSMLTRGSLGPGAGRPRSRGASDCSRSVPHRPPMHMSAIAVTTTRCSHRNRRLRCRRAAAAAATPLAFREGAETKPDLSLGVQEQAEAFRRSQAQRLSSRRGWAALDKKSNLTPWSHFPGELRARQVDIRVTHNGLCHTDLHMRDDDWGLSKFPFIPGHEVVGEVVAVGESVDSVRPGDRVGLGWIADSCRRCLACLRGQENICEHGYTGLIVEGNHGGFQETCRAHADFLYRIPDDLDSASAAPLLCAGVTVYAPLRRYLRVPGSRVGVLGVGGLGHLAVQFANKMGADVTALDISADKETESKQLGAHAFRTWNDAVGEAGLQGHFDLLLNCASANISTAQLLALLKNGGTLVQVGIPGGGATMTVPLQALVFGQKLVAGSVVGGRADMQEMLTFAGTHGVRPMVETMPLSQVNQAMKRVAEGKARYRIVLISDWE